MIFYALAISERVEFILLINFICLNDNKISFKNYLIVFIIFFAVSPWFTLAIIQHAKAWSTVIHYFPKDTTANQNNLDLIFTYISLIGFVIINFTYNFFKNNKIKKIYLLLLILFILQLVLTQKMATRYIIPGFIVLVYELHFYLITKEQLSKIGLILAAFLLLIYFNMQKFHSDNQILKKEINSSYTNVIGTILLKEELNFQNYNKLFGSHIKKFNIKNINFFKNDNAPLSLDEVETQKYL